MSASSLAARGAQFAARHQSATIKIDGREIPAAVSGLRQSSDLGEIGMQAILQVSFLVAVDLLPQRPPPKTVIEWDGATYLLDFVLPSRTAAASRSLHRTAAMSAPATLSRLLQETMRPSLAVLDGVSIRLANEDPTTAPLPLPAVVLSARDIEDNSTIKVSGRYARDCELRAACRVDGTLAGSAEAVEALAAKVEQTIAPRPADWLFFQPFRQTDERTWEGNTRVITLVWKLIVLPAV